MHARWSYRIRAMFSAAHRPPSTRPRPGSHRRHALRVVLLLVLSILAIPRAEARGPGFSPSVNAQVAAAKRTAPEIGVHIVEVSTGETVYSYRADTQRIIASNTKLVTTAAALDRLGPGYFFETEVLVRGELENGVLRGDLGVLGGGDPNISGRHYQGDPLGAFREWARSLHALGIERVAGDLVLYPEPFDGQLIHPDWPRDQLTRWYEAPVAGLSFNDNCVLVKVLPGGGGQARVETVPQLGDLFEIEANARTTMRRRDQWLSIDRKQSPGVENVLAVRGAIYRRTESVDKWVTVPDPVAYFGAALQRALDEEGIAVTGGVRQVDRPLTGEGWRRLHVHRSDLLTTLEIINKRSQNFYAESVLKTLGAELCGEGSWAEGRRAVEEFLGEVGLDAGSYRLADGSGMSRNNRFTPRQLTGLLRHMFFHPWGREYVQTLPFSGEVDLRWERRLSEGPYRGNVMAKTGYLNGVTALSGYAKARSGKIYAFSILSNRIRGKSVANAAEDRIVRALIDHG